MKTVFRIFWRDLRRILRNPVALIVTIGVCIIPSLYAWLNILANWDPYANTSDIKVAIVNEDAGADAGSLGHINAGDMVVERLRENTQLGWTFTDEGDGMQGVESGRYYATIVIPEDFTQSLADVLDGDTSKADLDYYVNEKMNPVSPKVTDTGASTIEQQIDDTFAGTVSEVIAERVADGSAEALTSLGDAEGTLDRQIGDVQADLADLKGQLDEAIGSLGSVRTAVASTNATLGTLAATSETSAADLRATLDGLSGTRVQVRDTTSGLTQALTGGVTQLGSVTARANGDLGALAADVAHGARLASDSIDDLEDVLDRLTADEGIEAELSSVRTLSAGAADEEGLSDDFKLTLDNDVSATVHLGEQLGEIVSGQRERLDALRADAQRLEEAATAVGTLSGSLSDALSGTAGALGTLQSDIDNTTVPAVNSALDSFSGAGSSLASTLASLGPTLRQTQGILTQLDDTLAQAQSTVQATSDQLGDVIQDVAGLSDDLGTIRSSQLWQALEDASHVDPQSVADFMNGPVELEDEPVYPVENYGSGVTPFYTNLALWVGGFVLVAIYKLEVDEEEVGSFRPWQGYLGRWLLLNLLGLVQALVCCVGDLLLGIQCVSPVAFVFAGVVEAFAYVGFIYALSIAFKHIGKALGVLLVVLQIPGASGTYPVEMMLDAYRALSPWLPFTYGINAMREAIAGFYDHYFAYDLVMLLLLLVPASVLVGLGARRHLLNINTLFDRKLAETDLMISERVPAGQQQLKLSTIVKALLNHDEYAEAIARRAERYERVYPTLVRRGFWSLVTIPIILTVLMFVFETKFVFLMLWVLSLVVICTYLIVVEYLRYRLRDRTRLTSLTRDELLDVLNDKLDEEFFAFAPIEKLRLAHRSPMSRLRGLRASGWGPLGGGAPGDAPGDGPDDAPGDVAGPEDDTARLDDTGDLGRAGGMRQGRPGARWTMGGTEIRTRDEGEGGKDHE